MEILIPIEIFFSSIIEILVIENSLSSQILISFSFFNRYDRTGRNNKKKKTGSGFPHTDVALSINGIVVGCRRNVTFFKNSQSRNASRRLTRSRRRRRNVFRHPDGCPLCFRIKESPNSLSSFDFRVIAFLFPLPPPSSSKRRIQVVRGRVFTNDTEGQPPRPWQNLFRG